MKAGYLVGTPPGDLKQSLAALKRAGCERILVEGEGARAKNTLHGLVRRLSRGDTLVVWSMASVANSMPELVKLILDLEDKGVRFQALAEKFDTGGKQKLALKTLLQQLQHFEEELLERKKTAVSRRGGQRPGRPKILSRESVSEARKLLKKGVPISEIAQKLHVSRATLYRYLD
jgi:DNA invertase Pin-like site-specific DNA recombinase